MELWQDDRQTREDEQIRQVLRQWDQATGGFMRHVLARPATTVASALPPTMSNQGSSQRENYQRPNETVLTPSGGHDIPAAINSPGYRQGHDPSPGLKAQEATVLTCRRPPHPESAG